MAEQTIGFPGTERRRPPRPRAPELLNRDLSWLEFNRRVLHEAVDERTPLLERVNFLSIFTSNLDEFVMKRVYGLREQLWADGDQAPGSGELLAAVRTAISEMLALQADAYGTSIVPALAQRGVQLLCWADLTDAERDLAHDLFTRTIFPVLTPLSVDVGHPFPFISNLSISLGLMLEDPESREQAFARVKVPDSLPQWIRLETPDFANAWRYVHLLDLIEAHLSSLFPGMTIRAVTPFRVTRNADVDSDLDDVEDLLAAVEEGVRTRRMECVVRLELPVTADPDIGRLLMEELELSAQDVYSMPGLLEYRSLRPIASLPVASLHYPPWRPVVPKRLRGTHGSIFEIVRAGDLLVHHPYDSFDESVLRFVREAAEDPDVLAIKMTLYRTGRRSPFVPLLIQAAEAGKQVACLVELTARFDEQENIQLAKRMEKAGVHVVYGLGGLKTHTKTTLVVRREGGETLSYAHIGTGNYHFDTARLYVDLGLLTCRPELTTDLGHVFNYLTGRSRKHDYQTLLVAPANMKGRFLELVQREVAHHEAGRPARIIGKMNQLEDKDICRALHAAALAGVAIDLIVRGFCLLRPDPELAPNLRILSVIGRFLEHSRIFYFRNGVERDADGEFFIGSADWMHRNLDARVEVVTPVADRLLRDELWEILQVHLADRRSAWDMLPDGRYVQRRPEATTPRWGQEGSHQMLMQRARRRTAERARDAADARSPASG
jgi:polyphosphate kinase